jgi:hypothetical protein
MSHHILVSQGIRTNAHMNKKQLQDELLLPAAVFIHMMILQNDEIKESQKAN